MRETKIYKHFVENKKILILLSIYTFVFLFFCSKMSPLYPVNEWADINIYFNMGKAMMNGRTLYTEAFDHKGPLIFFIYGIGYLISNDSFFGMFLIQLVLWMVMVIAVYFTAKQFLNSTFSGIVALLTPYSMLSFMNTGGSAEEFVLIFAIVSLCLFVAYFKSNKSQHKPTYMLMHGALSMAVALTKVNLVVFWFFPLAAIFIQLLLNKEYKNLLQNALAHLVGCVVVFIPILIYFIANGAVADAYHVYIELNKQYSSTNDYAYLISNGFSKLITTFRANLIWFVILFTGILYFPYRFIKNKLASVSLMLSGLSLVGVIFFTLTFHFYYPLALFVFVVLGLIAIFDIIQKSIRITNSKVIVCLSAALILIMAVGNRNFYGMGAAALLRISYPTGPQFQFKEEILKEDNPTLLNIAFGEGNAVFTTCNIVPNTKYFISPNIYYDMYPNIRDEQTKYIESKKTDFIVSSTSGFNYEYFEELPALAINYNKIDSVNSGGVTYFLYKKK